MQILPIVLLSLCLPLAHQQSLFEGLIKFVFEIGSSTDEASDDVEASTEYDFVIVGAGTAGCVLANRLSENPKWNILLIEAGGEETAIMDIPAAANYIQLTKANWKYQTIPSQNYCKSLVNTQCDWPRGKVMGGSSTINYMIYTRGSPLDYDNWAKLGNKGWSYKDVLPYFKKIENFKIEEFQDEKYHGRDGLLSIDYVPYRTNISKFLKQAYEEMGIEYLDYNGKKIMGFSYLQSTMQDGIRHSSNRAYISPVRDRKNLVVIKESMVKRLVMDKRELRAVGVEIVNQGRVFRVSARKEVVVSAGVLNSPQILMLSGIGPKRHLEENHIEVLKNLKVGYNLMDHVSLSSLYFTINRNYTASPASLLEGTAFSDFIKFRKGPLTLPGGCEIISFHNLDEKDPRPQIEILYVGASIASDPVGESEIIYETILKPLENTPNYLALPLLLLPKSKGRIFLQDSNYKSKPLIFPNYFSHPQDMKYLIEGIKISVNLTRQPTMQKLDVQLFNMPIPACVKLPHLSDEYFECLIRETTTTGNHQSGTCKMGPVGDKTAVVDERLRVHGVKGLRVADASIMPEIVAGHTAAPVYMIAEKAADMIKEDWGFK